MAATAEQLKQFQDQGYLLVENFISEADIQCLRQECSDLVEKMDPAEHSTIFSCEKQSYRDDYFIKSADKVKYFFEDGALDENGKLIVDKHRSLNKIGHALHVYSPSFRRVTFSQKVKDMVASLQFKDPVIAQSMYIFKQPKIGGKVGGHQDSSYLYTEPMRLMGMWIALEDCTLDNGCLSFIPGSHKWGLVDNYRMVRNPEPSGPTCIFENKEAEFKEEDFVAGPVKKGTLVVIDGLIVHKSEANTSENSRHIYVFHLYDAHDGKWSEKNWMVPTDAGTFQHLNDVQVD